MLKIIQRQIKNTGQPKILTENNSKIIDFLSYVIYILSIVFFVSMSLGLAFEKPLFYNGVEVFSIYRLAYFHLGITGVLYYIFSYNSPNNFYKIIKLHLTNSNKIYAKSFKITFLGIPFMSWILSLILIPIFTYTYFDNDFWLNLSIAYLIVSLISFLLTVIQTIVNLFFNNERFFKHRTLIFIVFISPVISFFYFSQKTNITFNDFINLVFILSFLITFSYFLGIFFLKKK